MPLQRSLVSGRVIGSEDCLYLNVHVPKNLSGEELRGLPVVVWIYGGAWIIGGANQKIGIDEIYDGKALVEKGRVIFVSGNYRLGPMGFLAHPDLAKEAGSLGSTGNYGLMDQVALLQWVQRNIAQFGGNPDNVTVMGESAGGGSILALLASPYAKGLMRRVVLMSAPFMDIPLAAAETIGIKAAKRYGAKNMTEFRAIDGGRIILDFPLNTEKKEVQYGPVVDGAFLPDSVLSTILNGENNEVDVIMGSTVDEMRGMLDMAFAGHLPKNLTDENYLEELTRQLGEELSQQIINFYTKEKYGSNRKALMAFFGDWVFQLPLHQLNKALRQDRKPKKIYRYVFSQDVNFFGPSHGMELSYMFEKKLAMLMMNYNPLSPFTLLRDFKKQIGLSRHMIVSVSNFAWTGDPNGEGLPHWPQAGRGEMMEFNQAGTGALRNFRKKEMKFLDGVAKTCANAIGNMK